MNYKQYNDIAIFHKDTYDVLMRHEAQNLIPLGNLVMGHKGEDKRDWRDPANWFMAAVSDERGVRLTAVMTPPHNLTLYATDNEVRDDALSCLVRGMADVPCPGVSSMNDLARRFAEIYAKARGLSYKEHEKLRIYALTEVRNVPATGTLRPAKESDMSFLPYWGGGFNADCFNKPLTVGDNAENFRYLISEGNLFILENHGTPVSMAKIGREMRSVCGISLVYTPPYFRGKGYAASCVAEVCGTALSRGFHKCALYADLANPASNSIYQKIGFVPIGDSADIKFT